MAARSSLIDLPPLDLRDRLAGGAARAAEVADAAAARVESDPAAAAAFAWFDADFARRQGVHLDTQRGRLRSIGALHGLPVAVDDMIDAARMPAIAGFAPFAGRVPEADSAIVERLRSAGALIAGKTAVRELGIGPAVQSTDTDAPVTGIDGCVTAVARGAVSLGVGMSGDGALIRSASASGITGYTPTFGAIPRRGVRDVAPSLDAPGVCARSISGVALLAECLFGNDLADPSTEATPHPQLLAQAGMTPPVVPTLAIVRTPWWDRADPLTQEGIGEVASELGERCFDADLPEIFADGLIHAERVRLAEAAKNLYGTRQRYPGAVSPELTALLEQGDAILARDYLAAIDWRSVLYAGLEAVLSRCDAILTPAAIGPARPGVAPEGENVFNALWTFLEVPCVTLPLLETPDGQPIGVQLVGRRGEDGRLLRTAHWLETQLTNGSA
ncbi:amidase [Aurantimonas coralicida]|uniref:amidase n=1 Tax=Aurantimonas coralicida TaxID=182270 RepID=UPI001D182074|nr:amidase family protein [Aurantimonas coralicida]MCC4298249.1 amidase [Aurantimonas coralicida]